MQMHHIADHWHELVIKLKQIFLMFLCFRVLLKTLMRQLQVPEQLGKSGVR